MIEFILFKDILIRMWDVLSQINDQYHYSEGISICNFIPVIRYFNIKNKDKEEWNLTLV